MIVEIEQLAPGPVSLQLPPDSGGELVHARCPSAADNARLWNEKRCDGFGRAVRARHVSAPRSETTLDCRAAVDGPDYFTVYMMQARFSTRGHYNDDAPKVSQAAIVPCFSPMLNQRCRCSDEPCVKASGTT